jgi:HEPN domain-containing protein/predicted nucleotidyltransferase
VKQHGTTRSALAGRAELIHHVAAVLEVAKLSFRLTGAILFGSTARDEATAGSDVDLLAVAEELPPKCHRRARQIGEIKQLFPGVPLDVLLLTPDEVRSNFANHNPLFLDIAEDGTLLLDNGTLSEAMRETRQYVRARGIIRTPQGWRFPVERGAPTYLSKVSNRDFAFGMLKDAEPDLEIGRRLLEEKYYDKAVYHFQQTAEKGVKGALIALGVLQKTHFVGAVLRQTATEERVPEQWRPRLAEAASLSEELEPDMSLSRYPGIIDDTLWLPSEEYTDEDARAAALKAARALTIVQDFVQDWFRPPPDGES